MDEESFPDGQEKLRKALNKKEIGEFSLFSLVEHFQSNTNKLKTDFSCPLNRPRQQNLDDKLNKHEETAKDYKIQQKEAHNTVIYIQKP